MSNILEFKSATTRYDPDSDPNKRWKQKVCRLNTHLVSDSVLVQCDIRAMSKDRTEIIEYQKKALLLSRQARAPIVAYLIERALDEVTPAQVKGKAN
jgi:hypothetical protein